MATRLKKADGARANPRPVVERTLRLAIQALHSGTASGVHVARRNIKRTRAVLRLLRDAIPEADCEKAMGELQKAGRAVAGLRDSHVAVETLNRLLKGCDAPFAASLAKTLDARRVNSRRVACADARHTLEEFTRELAHWFPSTQTPDRLRAGLRRLKKRAKRAFLDAREEPDTQSLHEWRKRVKDYQYALECLDTLCPNSCDKVIKELGRIASLLGEDHDIAVFLDLVATVSPETLPALSPIAAYSRSQLRKRVLRLGKSVFK